MKNLRLFTSVFISTNSWCSESHYLDIWWVYKYKLAANTMSLLILRIPSENLFSSSVFPMAFAARDICLANSSNLRMQRITLPKICRKTQYWLIFDQILRLQKTKPQRRIITTCVFRSMTNNWCKFLRKAVTSFRKNVPT